MSRIVCFLVLIFWFHFSFSQDYLKYNSFLNKYSTNALSDFDRKKIELQYLDSAFNCVNGNGFIDDYIRAMSLSIEINNIEKAKKYYIEALKKGATKWYIKNDLLEKNFKVFKNTNQYKDANKYYRANKNEWKIKKNKKLCREIRKIMYRDQTPRYFKNLGKTKKNDSINIATLKQIYYDIGRLPNLNDIGLIYVLKLQIPLLHYQPEDVCFFANILLEMYLKGDYNDLDFIFEMIDQASTRYGANFGFENNKFLIKETVLNSINELGYHKQSFGFIAYDIREQNGYWYKYYLPVYDKDYANEIRQHFGYVSLEELSKSNKYHIYDEQLFIEKWGDFIERSPKMKE